MSSNLGENDLFPRYDVETRLNASLLFLPRIVKRIFYYECFTASNDDKVRARLLKIHAKQPQVTRTRERRTSSVCHASENIPWFRENTRRSHTWSIIKKTISPSSFFPFSPFISLRHSRMLKFLCNVDAMLHIASNLQARYIKI